MIEKIWKLVTFRKQTSNLFRWLKNGVGKGKGKKKAQNSLLQLSSAWSIITNLVPSEGDSKTEYMSAYMESVFPKEEQCPCKACKK